jgi:hypothetical protein
MLQITKLTQYLANLPNGKIVLWCYLIWYINTVIRHFDPSPSIWLNSAGISALIGVALVLSVGGRNPGVVDRWQTFRLFAIPFCVSSFSSLIKGKGFILIVPPSTHELVTSIGLCASFAVVAIGLRKGRRGENS